MPSSSTFVRLSFALAALALVVIAAPRPARAQTGYSLTLVPSEVRKLKPDQKTPLDRTIPSPNEQGISYLDCVDDIVYYFPLTVSANANSKIIEAWVSAENVDCSAEKRTSTTNAECWRVYSATVGASQTLGYYVRAQDIVSQISVAAKQNPATITPAGPSACTSVTTSSVVRLAVQWLLFDSTTLLTTAKFSLPVDVVPPVAPTITGARGAEGFLFVNLAVGTDADGGSEPDLSGYVVYCDPPPGYEKPANERASLPKPLADDPSQCTANTSTAFRTLPTGAAASALLPQVSDGGDAGDEDAATPDAAVGVDGGVVADAGTGPATDAGTSTSTSSSRYLDDRFICKQIGASTANRIQVGTSEFQIGYPYQLAVASKDNFGNASAVSDIRCAIPVNIDDFWEGYKGAGGAAVGCALDASRVSGGVGLAFAALAAAVLVARRRRAR